MTVVAIEQRVQGRLRTRLLLWVVGALLLLPATAAAAVWSYGPYWIAPVEDFPQGPGGAVAYISLLNQVKEQSPLFWSGGDVRLVINEAEFSGMLSSALLSGRKENDPIRKVRAGLEDGEIRVETVLQLQRPDIPERYQGPVGLKVRLNPVVTDIGIVQFQINRATVGRIPVPRWAIRWGGKVLPAIPPGFDAETASLSLPLSDLIAANLGRRVAVKSVSAQGGKLALVIALAPVLN